MPADTTALVPAETRVEEVRSRLAMTRVRARQDLVELRTEIARRTDWRTYVRARPMIFLATAFVLGFLLGNRR